MVGRGTMAGLMLEVRREARGVMVGCHQVGRQEEGMAVEEQEGGTGRGGGKGGISNTMASMRPQRGLGGGVSEALLEHHLAT
jgi:hypothetical protein